jgi:hypothetical protein
MEAPELLAPRLFSLQRTTMSQFRASILEFYKLRPRERMRTTQRHTVQKASRVTTPGFRCRALST